MPRVKKIKSLKKSANALIPKREPMTKFKFVMAVLWGTAMAQLFILAFSIYATIIFFGNIKKINISEAYYQNNPLFGKVIYRNDKVSYRPDEMIKLDIVNNSNESIYLAPCQYFNKFEKKVSDKWQAISLSSCDGGEFPADSASFEKISKKVEDSVMAARLGEGVWRGVSSVYFGCQKAQISSCKNNKTIYTGEFMIGKSGIAIFSNPQL